MVDRFIAWLRGKSFSTHSIGAAVSLMALLIITDETVRNLVLSTFSNHPKIGAAIVTISGLILKYSHSSSPAGTVGRAVDILNAPHPPTPSEVEATKGAR